MSKEELLEQVNTLINEIRDLETCDDATRTRLTHLARDIRQSLEDEDEDSDWGDVTEAVTSRIEQFEFQHPALTRAIDQIMNTLNSMGI